MWWPVQRFGCSNSYSSSLILPGCHSVTSRRISQSWRCVTWRPTRCRVTRGTAGWCPWTRVVGWEAALLGAAETTPVGLNLSDLLLFLIPLIAKCKTLDSRLFARHILDQPSVPSETVRGGRRLGGRAGDLHYRCGSDAEGPKDAASAGA